MNIKTKIVEPKTKQSKFWTTRNYEEENPDIYRLIADEAGRKIMGDGNIEDVVYGVRLNDGVVRRIYIDQIIWLEPDNEHPLTFKTI